MLRSTIPATLVAELKRTWRRSLQFRVVTITLATSGALVMTFGLVVGQMITSGLLSSHAAGAEQQVISGSSYASTQIQGVTSGRDPLLRSVVAELANRAQASGADVAILTPGPDLVGWSAKNVDAYTRVPAGFRAAVADHDFVSQRLRLDLGAPGGEKLYLVFGREVQVTLGTFQLYYFFPLDEQVNQAALVGSTITLTGLTLVVMLAAVAYLVTRMVVSPVRVAARTAQRLSNGLLDQRMEVRGEDDLAALAASFNQMAENLQRHILRLEDMSRLQRRFTSDVSHELRTPLTTVRMAADLLFNERERFGGPAARSAELLQTELDRFESLLSELLEISRFDAGFAALDAEPANLGPLVRRATDRLGPVAERAGVEVEVDVPGDPVIAEVDVRRVERILRNLIGNAIEHGDGRPVKVRLRAREGAVAITVRDYGMGLKPGEEKLVFNRFWRADPARARHTGGTGLGLSISAEDARLHGGWLDAWGAPGQGAQFRLTLPVAAGATLSSSPLPLRPTDVALSERDTEPDVREPAVPEPVAAVPETGPDDADRDAGEEPLAVADGGRTSA
jgi:two-component system, OmpR family, sensor histidine kinase MtrB